MPRLWVVGFIRIDSKAEYAIVCETEQEAERIARELFDQDTCWRIAVWEL